MKLSTIVKGDDGYHIGFAIKVSFNHYIVAVDKLKV